MGYLFDIELRAMGTTHPVGGFGTARAAAVATHVEASRFGPLELSVTELSNRISGGASTIRLRGCDPVVDAVICHRRA